MKKTFGWLGVAFVLATTLQYSVLAATKGDVTPKAQNGAVAVTTAAAVKVFTGMTGRNVFSIFNNGPNTIWCGFRSNVSNTTGYPVPASASLSIDLVFNAAGDADFYCRADTADQVNPLDTRWIQVK